MQSITLIIAVCFAIQNLGAQNYIITTIAGTGYPSFSGDGGLATSAKLHYPSGIVTDTSGNLYIADYENNRIRKINTSGIITTIAGNGIAGYSGDGGLATAAELQGPASIALDALGNLYIADYTNNCIRKVNTSGIITTIAGNSTPGYSGDGGIATAAQLHSPNNLVLDASGNLYIADANNNVIRKVNTSGTISTIAGNGSAGYNGDGNLATSAELNPFGVFVDASGNVYIADHFNNCIRKVNTSGIISTIAGNATGGYSGDGGSCLLAKLTNPLGIVLDDAGNIYIADTGNNVIRKISTSDIITTIAGNGNANNSGDGGLATLASLYGPNGLCVDDSGNIYIADTFNNRIRKLTPLPSSAGVSLNTKVSYKLYPNPIKNELTIESQGDINQIEVYNLTGQLLQTSKSLSAMIKIDFSAYEQGIYLVKIHTTNGQVTTSRVVKE